MGDFAGSMQNTDHDDRIRFNAVHDQIGMYPPETITRIAHVWTTVPHSGEFREELHGGVDSRLDMVRRGDTIASDKPPDFLDVLIGKGKKSNDHPSRPRGAGSLGPPHSKSLIRIE